MMKGLLVFALSLLAAGCAPTAEHTLGSFLANARKQQMPVLIYAYGIPGQIAVGANASAVPVYVQFVVTGDRPIQSIRFTLLGYTTRGAAVRSPHGLGVAITLIGPGPFDPNKNYEVNSFHSTPAGFPGGNVACVVLAQMQILYGSGAHKNYDAITLRPLLLPPLRKGCEDNGPPVNFMIGDGDT